MKDSPKRAFYLCSCLIYFCNLPIEERIKLTKFQCEILELDEISIQDLLLKDEDKILFQSFGLANDLQSLENSALLIEVLNIPYTLVPTPLLMDPSKQALNWLKNYCEISSKPFDIIHHHDKNLSYHLELAIRFGKILIVTEIIDVPSSLFTIIQKKIWTQSEKQLFSINGQFIEMNDNFRLVLISSLESTTLAGNIKAFLNPIYFTTTVLGFTDQLISNWIHITKPEWEMQRNSLLKEESNLLKIKENNKNQLLVELSNAQGNILENEVCLQLIETFKY